MLQLDESCKIKCQFCVEEGDPKYDPLKSGMIQKLDFLKVRSQMGDHLKLGQFGPVFKWLGLFLASVVNILGISGIDYLKFGPFQN